MDDDDKDLSYYGVVNGGEILMEEKQGVKEGDGKEVDEAARSEREQIETMEAIRMAQREEVEASKGAAAAASGRKVDAADVVPFVSKLR